MDEDGGLTMENIVERKWFISKKEYIDNLNLIYDRVSSIHRYSKSYYFTDHSITHSNRIIDDLLHLFPFLFYNGKEEDVLNDVEKFILFSSILLHDIGIQLVNKEKLQNMIEKYGLYSLDDYSDKAILDYVRKNHHILSKFWILENAYDREIKLSEAYYGERVLAKYVANVVESHGEDFEKSPEHTEITAYGNERIRMGLLCTLLSLGDALDCDQRRIDYNTLLTSDISLESRLHWMKHYYVDGIILTPNLIQIYYSFPQNSDSRIQELYREYFVAKTKYWIEKCFTVRKDFLFPVGAICRVVDTVKFQKDKEELSEKELLMIQNYYIDMLLESDHRINYLQYVKAVILNDDDEFLMMKDDNSVVISVPVLKKEDASDTLKSVFRDKTGNDIDKFKCLGSYISDINALNYFYAIKCDKTIITERSDIIWIKKEKFEEIVKSKNDNMLIRLLDVFYFGKSNE